jgi:DTW domain-containing protein YfiP
MTADLQEHAQIGFSPMPWYLRPMQPSAQSASAICIFAHLEGLQEKTNSGRLIVDGIFIESMTLTNWSISLATS